MAVSGARERDWPELPLEAWSDTLDTLLLWGQIVGKVKLALAPLENHWWGITLRVGPRGLDTGVVHHGERPLELRFDFVDEVLRIDAGAAGVREVELRARSVASFHREVMAGLEELGTPVVIHRVPSELVDPIPFDEDEAHASWDGDAVRRFHRALLQADRLLRVFQARFLGKSSPVHFFWGAFDLALTRFSGGRAPEHPGGFPNMPDWVTREAYSHEVHSVGWWPGQGPLGRPAFYAYAYPPPAGFAEAAVPEGALYHEGLGEFVLPWDDVRRAGDPDALVLDFLQATYEAAAEGGGWDRAALERGPGALEDLEARVRRSDRAARAPRPSP